ncbi:MAG: hypothetical protein RSF40_12170 [Oscillospiraceae bacterium]
MTFEKVLEVFKEYLAEDTNCEVVFTTHGYTVMQWDENSKSWYGVEYCEAPEDLQEELLSSYRMSEAEKITKTKRELTEEETAKIQELCQGLVDRCKY